VVLNGCIIHPSDASEALLRESDEVIFRCLKGIDPRGVLRNYSNLIGVRNSGLEENEALIGTGVSIRKVEP